jgi:glyceraldehyde-3-phosphate dehydrogenase/erythrose-4-phosphate dehydrogenase
MKRLKVGINGFGRIGRAFTRIATERNNFDIVAVNTRKTKSDMMAYLLQYDSVYLIIAAIIWHTGHLCCRCIGSKGRIYVRIYFGIIACQCFK